MRACGVKPHTAARTRRGTIGDALGIEPLPEEQDEEDWEDVEMV